MNNTASKIRAEIAAHGPISFARFMEVALYCPEYGFYEKEKDTVGRRGDFYTSVSVGPLFGQLLAFQFAEWLAASGTKARQIVEAGAHDGRLARDILEWLQSRRPDVFAGLEYVIIEPSEKRRGWQRDTLKDFAAQLRWLNELPREPQFDGVIFSNELLDAMPVHRLGWDAARGEWFEWGVTVANGRFVWNRIPVRAEAASFAPGVPAELRAALPDGFITEIYPAAIEWWRAAARSLKSGRLMTMDYALEAEEFFAPHRAQGTLRAYRNHRVSDDLLIHPGEQDLTAHMNFTVIRESGERAGLNTEANVSQARFLTDIAQRAWQANSGFVEWTSAQTKQFQTLTHPDHLGRAFRVLVQSRTAG